VPSYIPKGDTSVPERFYPQQFENTYHCCGGEHNVRDKKGNDTMEPNYGIWIKNPITSYNLKRGEETVLGYAITCSRCRHAHKAWIKQEVPLTLEQRVFIKAMIDRYRMYQFFTHEIINGWLDDALIPAEGDDFKTFQKKFNLALKAHKAGAKATVVPAPQSGEDRIANIAASEEMKVLREFNK
jgi:hypothetical protein